MNTSGGGISGSQTFTANATGNSTFTVALNSSTAASNNTIVQRNSSGYIYANYFNTTPNDVSSGITKVCVETGDDGFIRHGTAGAIRSFINVADGATNTTNPNNATITIAAGTSLSGGGDFTTDQSSNETITINHADTSSQASVNNTGRTYIQDITLDTHGHITGITSATETVVNTDTNTVTQIREDSGAYRTGNITLQSGTNVTITEPSTGVFNISSTDTNTDTNTVTTNIAGNGISVSSGTGNSTIAMTGSFNGTFTASADIVAFSDEKLKDNIQTLDGSKVFDMRGASFNRNDQDGKQSSGVIAQELEKIAPELVHENEDGTKGVAYGNTVGYLIEAIKLLKAEIEELKDINKKV